MISIKTKKTRLIIVTSLLILAAIPLLITAYEIITSGKDSVIFLGNYPPAISLIIFILYCLLLAFLVGLGIRSIIIQLKSFINLKNEQTNTELLHLQSQVNPHFFFNTLNNLYGLVEKDSKKAQKLILKLSDMMRYSIYEGQKESVTIEEEVKYMENYIDLQKMRYHKNIEIQFNCDIQEEKVSIMPLLLIILLENAFKHGAENLREGAFVYVNIICNRKVLNFSIENNFDKENQTNTEGIGLKNLKRRLELVYPNKHSLSCSKIGNTYKAELTLEL